VSSSAGRAATSVRIVIADDHALFRDGLRTLLERQKNFQVVAEATNGLDTVALVTKHKPDIVFLDVSMPGLNGVEAARQILSQARGTRIIMLSMHSNDRFVVEALKAGAKGYVLKDNAFDELLAAVKSVMADRIYLSRLISEAVIRDYIALAQSAAGSVFSVLSAREREVLQLMAEGKATKEIAASLQVSVKTIETHRKQIMDKLDVHSVAELTKYAIREGLTSLD
jgi:DNA-binding NarL/FixJ family response regulator